MRHTLIDTDTIREKAVLLLRSAWLLSREREVLRARAGSATVRHAMPQERDIYICAPRCMLIYYCHARQLLRFI